MYILSKKINLATAKALANAAYQSAQSHNVPGAVAIVDDGGNLIYLERWDNTMIAAADIVVAKAKTAVGFQRPTQALENVIVEGRTPMLSLVNTVPYAPLKGGYPIIVEDTIIGGIAVGGTLNADMDEVVVLEALKILPQ
jgi:glc operon protein GlcG